MNEGAMELLRECRLLIIRLRNEARTGTGRDTISRIDALLAQSKAAPRSREVTEPCTEPSSSASVSAALPMTVCECTYGDTSPECPIHGTFRRRKL